ASHRRLRGPRRHPADPPGPRRGGGRMTADFTGALAADLARLTAAGVGAAATAVRRHADTARQMARKVPALASLADALDRAGASPAALLDALVIAVRMRTALATAGISGDLELPPPSGP